MRTRPLPTSTVLSVSPPGWRRLTCYAMTGPRLHTLYDLKVLALCANWVSNDRLTPYLKPVLPKGLRDDYKKLFRPLLGALPGQTFPLS